MESWYLILHLSLSPSTDALLDLAITYALSPMIKLSALLRATVLYGHRPLSPHSMQRILTIRSSPDFAFYTTRILLRR